MKRLFGADGIRNEADTFPLQESDTERIGRSVAGWLRANSPQPIFLVGSDTRESSPRLKSSFSFGLSKGGVTVVDVDILPTAAISFLIAKTGIFSGGAIISASHSPAEENGIKVFNESGMKLNDCQEEIIEQLFFGKAHLPDEIRPAKVIKDSTLTDIYINDMTSGYKDYAKNSPKIVIDCANGAGSKVFPKILDKLGMHFAVINASPNGVNINKLAGSEYARSIPELFACEILQNLGAYSGFVFDGDADRLIVIDDQGNLYDGNTLLAMFACTLKNQNKLAENIVVTTKMSNSGLQHFLHQNQIKTEYTSNGDKYITDRLVEKNLTLGGEAIGHIIIHDAPVHLTGDGLRTALSILRELIESRANRFQDLAPGMQKWPQIKVSIPINKRTKVPFNEIPGLQEAMQSIILEIGDVTQLECRPASTEPLYRIMLETRYTPVSRLIQICKRLAELIQKFFDVVNIPITVTDCVSGKKIQI